MSSEVTRADLQAIYDVANLLTEQSDSLGAEAALSLLADAKLAAAALKAAIDMLEAQALRQIEQPILIGKTAYSKVPTFKRRPDQARLASLVIRSAAADANGELRPAREAVEEAVELMAALYVSPSTVPKVGGVKRLGVAMDDVCTEEHTGYELKKVELD